MAHRRRAVGSSLLLLLVTTDASLLAPTQTHGHQMHTMNAMRQRTSAHSMRMLANVEEMLDAVPGWFTPASVALGSVNVIVSLVLAQSFKLFKDGAGAPFVPIASQKLESLFSSKVGALRPGGKVLNVSSCENLHLVDLGSGTGTIVRAATRVGGFAQASGYEINPSLYWLSVLGSLGRPNERFHKVSLWDADLQSADVVVVYGYPSFIERLGVKLGAELKEGAIVVSNAYAIPEGVPHLEPLSEIPVDTPPWSPDASSSLWLYRVSRTSERDSAPSRVVVPKRAAAQRQRSSEPQFSMARFSEEGGEAQLLELNYLRGLKDFNDLAQ